MYKKIILAAAEILLPLILELFVRYLKKYNARNKLNERDIKAAEKIIEKTKVAEDQIDVLRTRVKEKKLFQESLEFTDLEEAQEKASDMVKEAVHKAAKRS